MKEKRKLNKLKVSIVIIFLILTIAITVLGRYIYNTAREAYFASKQFYFSSDILTVDGSEYQYTNWGGTDVYAIEFELYSYTNQLTKLDYPLNYTITCSTSDSDKVKLRYKFL